MECKGVFIAWSRLSNRTVRYSKLLGLRLMFIKDRPPYLKAFFKTLKFLLKNNPRVIFVQLAPGLLLLLATFFKAIKRYFLVADMHSFFLNPVSVGGVIINKPFSMFLRFCDLILVHSNAVKEKMPSKLKCKSIVAYDPPVTMKNLEKQEEYEEFSLVFPASFAKDEPIENVIIAVKKLIKRGYKLKLFITGRYERRREIIKYANKNIIFTGFLPSEKYYELLQKCHVILALTRVGYSLSAAALEAMFLEKPLILSNKPVFKSIFTKGVIYTDNSVEDLVKKISYLIENKNVLSELKYQMREMKKRYIKKFNLVLRILRNIIKQL